MAALALASGVIAASIVFSHVRTIGGWNFAETIVLLGVFSVVSGLLETFIEPNLAWFAETILNGHFDDTLLQPAPSLFLVSLGTTQPFALSEVMLGAAVTVLGMLHTHSALSPINLFVGALLVVGGIVIVWSYRVLLASLAFWAPGLEASVLYYGLWQMGRYPVTIYRQPLRWGLTYLIPVAFVTAIPVHVLIHGPNPAIVMQSLGAICGSVATIMVIWRVAVRRYTSATS